MFIVINKILQSATLFLFIFLLNRLLSLAYLLHTTPVPLCPKLASFTWASYVQLMKRHKFLVLSSTVWTRSRHVAFHKKASIAFVELKNKLKVKIVISAISYIWSITLIVPFYSDLLDKFLRGRPPYPSLSAVQDIHVICGCLKLFLRRLSEPLITYHMWSAFSDLAEAVQVLAFILHF